MSRVSSSAGGIFSARGGSPRSVPQPGLFITNERSLVIPQGPSRHCGGKHCHGGALVGSSSGTSNGQSVFSTNVSGDSPGQVSGAQTRCKGLGAEGHLDSRTYPSQRFLQSPFLCQQERREVPSNSGLVYFKHLCKNPFLCDGGFGFRPATHHSGNVGVNFGRHGCLSDDSNSSEVPGSFLFRPGWSGVHVSKDAFWIDNGSLGLFSDYASCQNLLEDEGRFNLFFHRRFFHPGNYPGIMFYPCRLGGTNSNLVRFPDKLCKIFPGPSAVCRISGYSYRPQTSHPRSSTRQSVQTLGCMSTNVSGILDYSSQVGGVGGISEFRASIPFVGTNASSSTHQVDEPLLFPSFQRSPIPNQSRVGDGFAALPRCQLFSNSDLLQAHSPIPGSFYGRLRLRLEWGGPAFPGPRLLDALGNFQFYQLEGNGGHSQDDGFPSFVIGSQINQNCYRQFGSIFLFEKNGFSSLRVPQRSFTSFSFVVSRVQHYICTCPHLRLSQCSCRPGFKEHTDLHGMVLGSRVIRLDFPSVSFLSSGRPFCYEGEFSIFPLCFSLPRPRCLFYQCLGSRLESVPVHLCLSTSSSHGSDHRPDLLLSRDDASDCSFSFSELDLSFDAESGSVSPASSGVLPNAVGQRSASDLQGDMLESGSVAPSTQEGVMSEEELASEVDSVFSFLGFPAQECLFPAPEPDVVDDWLSQDDLDVGTPMDPQIPEGFEDWRSNFASRVDVWVDSLVESGIDPDVSRLITCCNKESTKRQYQSGWNLWLRWCFARGINHDQVMLSTVINFLGRKFLDDHRALSTIKNYFYAIRDPIFHVYKIDIMKCSDIQRLFAAIWRQCPGLRGMALMPLWSLQDALMYLNSPRFEPLESKEVDRIVEKTVFLMILATGRRVCEIAAITEDCVFLPDGVSFNWFEGFLAKAESHLSQWNSTLPKIVSISDDDKRLCPVRAFKIFYAVRRAPAMQGGLWPCGKISLSYLVRDLICESIWWAHPELPADRIPKVSCHDIRKMACSYSRKYFNRPWSELCDWVGTKVRNTLDSHYIRDVPRVLCTFQVPLGTIKPDTEPCNELRTD